MPISSNYKNLNEGYLSDIGHIKENFVSCGYAKQNLSETPCINGLKTVTDHIVGVCDMNRLPGSTMKTGYNPTGNQIATYTNVKCTSDTDWTPAPASVAGGNVGFTQTKWKDGKQISRGMWKGSWGELCETEYKIRDVNNSGQYCCQSTLNGVSEGNPGLIIQEANGTLTGYCYGNKRPATAAPVEAPFQCSIM